MRDGRSRVTELFASVPKPRWRRLLPTVGAVSIALTAGYLVLLAVGGVQVAANASYFPFGWLPVAGVTVPALVGIALLGFGIGRLLPSLVTPPVLAVAALAAQIAVIQQGWPLLLTPAFEAPDITVFTTVGPAVTATQALWFTGIGATGFCLAVAARARARVAALLPVALAAAVAVPVLSGVDSPVVADEDARVLVCDTDGPRVCVMRAHEGYLPALVGPAREALALLGKLPSPPTSVTEYPPADDFRSPSPDVVPVLFFAGPVTDPERLKLTLLAGAGTPSCAHTSDWDTVTSQVGARIVATSWFTGELAPYPGSDDVWDAAEDDIRATWQELRSLPAAEQAARMAAYREAALDCRGDLSTLATA
jgi:hypothetical protein